MHDAIVSEFDPRLDNLVETYEPETDFERALCHWTLGRKAYRFSQCGKVVEHECRNPDCSKKGLKKHDRISCELRFEPDCATRIAQATFDRQARSIEAIKRMAANHPEMDLVYLNVEAPLLPDDVSMALTVDELVERRKMIVNAFQGFQYTAMDALDEQGCILSNVYVRCPGVHKGRIKFRFIALVSQAPDPKFWKSLWPNLIVEASNHRPYHFEELLKALLRPYIPTNGVDRAYHEVIFNKVRQLRTHLIGDCVDRECDHGTPEKDAELFAEESLSGTANNSTPRGYIRCPDCGEICHRTIINPNAALERLQRSIHPPDIVTD